MIALQELAKAFDMEIGQSADKQNPGRKKPDLPITFAKNLDVTALAGIWEGRKITPEELRKDAWEGRL